MIRLGGDEDFNEHILLGVELRSSDIDLVRARHAGLSGRKDPAVLEWAASEGRVLLTHDAETMTHFAYQRITAGLAMPGVVVVRQDLPVREAIDEILIIAECSIEGEWEGQVRYLPL